MESNFEPKFETLSKEDKIRRSEELYGKLLAEDEFYPRNADDILMYIEHDELAWSDFSFTEEDFAAAFKSKARQYSGNDAAGYKEMEQKLNDALERIK